jgi:hypothetical protein
MRDAARASLRKRSTVVASTMAWSRSTFKATRWRSVSCWAAYTVPIPL